MMEQLTQLTGSLNGQLPGYVIFTGVMVGMLLILTGAGQIVSRRETMSQTKSRRMKMIARGQSSDERLAILKPPPRARGWAQLPFAGDLPQQIRRAGYAFSPRAFLAVCAMFAVPAFFLALRFLDPAASAAAAVAAGFGLPIALLRIKAKGQLDKLVRQLPEALDMMSRGLRVGHPLNNSIGIVAREMADPIGTEFGIIFDQVTYGEELPDAMQEFAERTGLEDVNYLSASIGIQHGTGSDLAGMLDTLAQVIRARIAIRRKVKALSSEGRLTAWILSALPFFIYGSVTAMTPDYYNGIATDPLYVPMMAAVAGFTVANALMLKKLVNFRV